METSVVTSKGQIVIPSKIRNRFRIKRGTTICFIEQGKDIILRPITDEYIDESKGLAKTEGKLLQELLRAKKDHH